MIILIFTVVAVISATVDGSLKIMEHQYPLLHYTKLKSEEYFTVGRPLVIVLPIAPVGVASSLVDSSNKEVGYLTEELQKSGRWPILVYNAGYKMKENMYTEIRQHGNYIILTSQPCMILEYEIISFMQQLYEMNFGDNMKYSWNPRAKFVVSVMSNCKIFENKLISKSILEHLWKFEVMNATVLFLRSNKYGGDDLHQNTTDSAEGTYVELHTWNPYENSDRCVPAKGNISVKVFTVRNLNDFRRSEIFRGYFDKNFHGCPVNVFVKVWPILVYSTGHIGYNDPKHQYIYVGEWAVELMRVIGKTLNMSLHIDSLKIFDIPFIFVGAIPKRDSTFEHVFEYTRNYLPLRMVWYTPCALQYQRWSRFFNIFSVDMWICFILSLVLAAITVRCISNYRHKSHLHQSKSYSNIFSVTTNIIAVSLSVSVNTQPRSAPLRLFFFCWVCYSIAISTVFQAYLTTFLIEPGYEEPIRTMEEMLKSKKNFGFSNIHLEILDNTSDSVSSAIVNAAVECPDDATCFIWAAVYHNISVLMKDLDMEVYRARGNWTDENKRQLLCEVEGGVFRTFDLAMMVRKGNYFYEFIDNVLGRIVEGGIFMHIKERSLDKLKIESKLDVHTFDDTYYSISIRHLQTSFYILMLGYVLAVACFVTEIM